MSRVSKDPGRKAQGYSEQNESGEIMSEDYYIGLSREQVEKLLNGEFVGKRPYNNTTATKKPLYNGTVRIHVHMLSDIERDEEPNSAFEW